MLPANERFKPRDLLARGAHDRLIMDRKLAALDCLAKVILEQLTLRGLGVHCLLEEAVLTAAGTLRRIKRKIGIADQGVSAGAARIPDCDPERSADRDLVSLDQIGSRNLLNERAGERFEESDIASARQHRLEL